MDNSYLSSRIQREQVFHDNLAANHWRQRSVADKLSAFYYDKTENGCIWGPVWRAIDVRQKNVLDYGCGSGLFSRLLADRGARVTAIDISSESVQYASSIVPKYLPVQFFVRDCHATQLPDSTFDYVFGNGIIHHLDVALAYREIARLLKPNGRAFFMEPMNDNPAVRIARRMTPAIRTLDEKPLKLKDIEMATRYGLKISFTGHFLTAVAGSPLQLLHSSLAHSTIRMLDKLDQFVFKAIPSSRQCAWQAMIEMEKVGAGNGEA